MGTKTKSLGLSSLVVTSLDKGASAELSSNGWPVLENPLKLATQNYYGAASVVPPRRLMKALSICKTTSGKDVSEVPELRWPTLSAVVRKASTGWRKRWNKRLLVLSESSLCLFKTENTKMAYKMIKSSDIIRIERSKRVSSDAEFTFTVVFNTGKKDTKTGATSDSWTFATNAHKECEEWKIALATHALISEILYGQAAKKDVARLQHFVTECNAQLEYHVADDIPLILLALFSNRKDILALLLRKGVDAGCLLRLDGRIRAHLPPVEVVDLLEITSRDLNVIGDDDDLQVAQASMERFSVDDSGNDGCWSLIHHFTILRDVESLTRLLQRVDKPTINARTRLGETGLTLALRRMDESDETLEGQDKVTAIVRLLLDHGADPNVKTAGGDTPFHLVCKRAAKVSPDVFRLFEEDIGVDLNKVDAYGDTPLHVLMKSGQMQLARRLAANPRVNLDIRDSLGMSSIVLAMKINEESFACFLLAKGADGSAACVLSTMLSEKLRLGSDGPTSPSMAVLRSDELRALSNESPIHLSIKLHLTSLALKLVEKLSVDVLVSRDGEGRTPLLLSILHSLLGVSHAIVTRFANDGHKSRLNDEDVKTGDTALHLAIRAGRVELTQALVDAGADIAKRNAMGETGIHVCTKFVERTYNSSGGYTALKLFTSMIDSDAKKGPASCINVTTQLVNKVPEQMRLHARKLAKTSREMVGAQAVLHQAAACPNEQCGLWLLDALFKSPVISTETLDGAGMTPLACAIEARNTEICRLLLARTSINRLVGFGRDSYLHLVIRQIGSSAPRQDLLNLIETLLYQGAFCGMWDEAGLSPLHVASSNARYLKVLKLLLRNGDVLAHRLDDRTEVSGLTPLMVAVRESKSPEVVELLLEAGADVRLLEPRTRKGVFQMCLEDGFEASPENLGVCVKLIQVIDESRMVFGSDEWKARRLLSERHAALVLAADEIVKEIGVNEESRHGLLDSASAQPSYAPPLNEPFIMCRDRFVETPKPEKGVILRSKRGFGAENDDARNTNKTLESSKKAVPQLMYSNKEEKNEEPNKDDIHVEQREDDDEDNGKGSFIDEEIFGSSTMGAGSYGDGFDTSTSAGGSEPKKQLGYHRLSQLDRILTMDLVRAEVLESAQAWVDSDMGKSMIAQMATILMNQSEERMTYDAAIALAKRNFFEEQLRDGLAAHEAKFRASQFESAEIASPAVIRDGVTE